MTNEIPTQYDPATFETDVYQRWLAADAFSARPRSGQTPYVIMMPLPNVTGALHMGHAIDGVMQDLLTRWHRMRGDNALWMPGIDHAGIATQAIVEKRLLELEGKTRHDIGRQELVGRIYEWSDRFRERIIQQQQAMGCSCDWDRQRYTMDDVCRRAVTWTFFALFRDGLIYRGDRMVNWDCHLQTAISDDEIVRDTVPGSFWHLRYPILDPAPGEPDHVTVATTRPETMLGDTAVACHPDPEAAIASRLAELQSRLGGSAARDRPALEEEIAALEQRRISHLPGLKALAAMAAAGRRVRLPLMDRDIPLIADTWARPDLGSGCVKITPAHDPNDYEVWQRHKDRVGIINLLHVDGTLNENAGAYAGMDRMAARERVVTDMDALGFLSKVEERTLELGLSDRSKTVVEPFISRQWFIHMSDVSGGVTLGRGTDKEFTAPGLAQAALDAASSTWRSQSNRQVAFHPDPERYANTYTTWLEEKRDWCISRQLWWGHRIPIWSAEITTANRTALTALTMKLQDTDSISMRLGQADGSSHLLGQAAGAVAGTDPWDQVEDGEAASLLVCLQDAASTPETVSQLEAAGLSQDPDVLDTWFSSGLWPHSTLGWPDPASAAVNPGQTPTAGVDGQPDALSFYYPGSCLVTGRDIITLWVVRMVVLGLYNMGDVPFTDVFLHATILDGKGERMSKSKGNGIDPVDIIERYGADAMRYVLCEIQTGTQDVRLPIQALSPFTGEPVDLATADHGRTIFTYLCPSTGKEFDVLGTMPDVPAAKLISDRFDVGRAFCNKLWNAARFTLLNLEGATFTPRADEDLLPEDRWILSRLSRAIDEVHQHLEAYNPSAALAAAREFFWTSLCDWYLEIIKPRMRDEAQAPQARQVLAFALDQVLRLLHPFVPFVTETLWDMLNRQVPERGLTRPLAGNDLLVTASWPESDAARIDPEVEATFSIMQETVRAIRDLRSRNNVPPSRKLPARLQASGETAAGMRQAADSICSLAGLESLEICDQVEPTPDAATAIFRDVEIHLANVVDPEAERERLMTQRKRLTKDLEASQKKLQNEKFVSRAKPEAVAKERAKAADLEHRIAAMNEHLAKLG